jgi:anti-sigma B factor antagonist
MRERRGAGITLAMEPIGAFGTDGGPPQLALTRTRIGHRFVVAAEGEIDLASVPLLRSALLDAEQSGCAEIWLDLSDVEFMDSTGITAIVDARGALDGRRFALICPGGAVRRVLDIAGIEHAIPIHPSRSAAHTAD